MIMQLLLVRLYAKQKIHLHLFSQVTPADVVSARAVRNAMGITSHPPVAYDEPLGETIEILDDDPPTESGPNKELLDLLDSPKNDAKSPEVVEIS